MQLGEEKSENKIKERRKHKRRTLEGASTAITVNAPTIYNASSSFPLETSHLGALTGQIPGERVKRIVESEEV